MYNYFDTGDQSFTVRKAGPDVFPLSSMIIVINNDTADERNGEAID